MTCISSLPLSRPAQLDSLPHFDSHHPLRSGLLIQSIYPILSSMPFHLRFSVLPSLSICNLVAGIPQRTVQYSVAARRYFLQRMPSLCPPTRGPSRSRFCLVSEPDASSCYTRVRSEPGFTYSYGNPPSFTSTGVHACYGVFRVLALVLAEFPRCLNKLAPVTLVRRYCGHSSCLPSKSSFWM